MKTLLYVGHYDTVENSAEQRHYVLSAVNKMRYICSAINRAGWRVKIVSPCMTKGKRVCPGKEVNVSERTDLKLFFSLAARSKAERVLRTVLIYVQLFFYLMLHTKRNEPIMVYHSLTYAGMIRFLKKIKGFRLLLEVEEIYADVTGNERDRENEFRLFQCADGFLFPTELLNETVNCANKPFAIIYGTYQAEQDRGVLADYREKGIHCVYAGTFDPRKGGAQAAIKAAEDLSKDYHVHILGFGSQEQIHSVKTQVDAVSQKVEACVQYDGLLGGEDYIRFIQSCHVGLSTQSPGAAFNETSFPSKVLSYLANGLRVVSIRLKVLERSSISDLLYYYDEDTPEDIAKAIKGIDFDQPYDSRAVLEKLDRSFTAEISTLLNKV